MNSIDAFAAHGSGNERATARNEQWYVETRAGILPMMSNAIEESLQRGVLQASTKVWKSGMQAWQPLASIACFTPQYEEPPSPPSSEAPLPALSQFDWGPDSLTPAPAPVHTLIRPVAPERRVARAQAKAPRPAREHGDARRPSWLRHRKTWQAVLLSAIAGTALGLAVYHPLLWRASETAIPNLAPAANSPQRAAVPLAAAHPTCGPGCSSSVSAAGRAARGGAGKRREQRALGEHTRAGGVRCAHAAGQTHASQAPQARSTAQPTAPDAHRAPRMAVTAARDEPEA